MIILQFLLDGQKKKGVQGMFNNAVLKGLIQVLQEKLVGLNDNLTEKAQDFLKELGQHLRKNGLGHYSISLLFFSFFSECNALFFVWAQLSFLAAGRDELSQRVKSREPQDGQPKR